MEALNDYVDLGKLAECSIDEFDAYYQDQKQRGKALYRRLIHSAMGATVSMERDGDVSQIIMLGSNNYLGFANDPYINKAVKESIDRFGCGVSGPPLLNGHTRLHEELEQKLAALKHCEDTLLYPSGFQANLGLVASLLKTGDLLLYDERSHASLFDGIRLARTTQKFKAYHFKHNNLFELKDLLHRARKNLPRGQRIYVAVEGVYSMDGDIAPLDKIFEICQSYDAQILLDDAHGTGVLGKNGGGSCEHFGLEGQIPFVMGTFSKAFGMTGGFICGSRKWINYMRFFARPYIFSAHLPLTTVAAVLAGLDLIAKEPHRREVLLDNARLFREGLNELGHEITSQTPIVPIPVPEHLCIRDINRRFYEEGLFLNAIEYPAVPLDKQRLRVSLSFCHSKEMIERSLRVFEKLGSEYNWPQSNLLSIQKLAS
jgi:glycine C-acetyltransferase